MHVLRIASVIAAVVTISAPLHSAEAKPEWLYKALQLNLSGAKCPARVASFVQWAQEAEAARETWQASDLYSSVASCYGEMGEPDKGARYLAKAVSLGFDSCYYLKTDAGLKKLPNYNAMVSKARQSPADFNEMVWVFREAQAIIHDTTMMITQNINRKDGGWTQVYTTRIPARKTSSASVMMGRWAIIYLQQHQRNMVMRSDMQRKNHNTKMTIINSMGTSRNNYYQQQQILTSRRIALSQAQARQRAIAARQFQPKGSTTPVSCSRY